MTEGRKFGFGECRNVSNWTEETMIVGLGIFGWLVCDSFFLSKKNRTDRCLKEGLLCSCGRDSK
jgi:hypothetical protein